jgi:hypothetical protein
VLVSRFRSRIVGTRLLTVGFACCALDRHMPTFGEALSADQIRLVVSHVRTFCTSRGWPQGDLNLPRALVTEKAYPENEAQVTISKRQHIILSGGLQVPLTGRDERASQFLAYFLWDWYEGGLLDGWR